MRENDRYRWWLRLVPHAPDLDHEHPGNHLVDFGRFKRMFCRRCRSFHHV